MVGKTDQSRILVQKKGAEERRNKVQKYNRLWDMLQNYLLMHIRKIVDINMHGEED